MTNSPSSQEEVREIINYCKSLHLLYVESNEQDRSTTLPLLSQIFGEITSASDVVEGFEKYRHATIDLVLTSARMPNGNGIGLIRDIRNRNPQMPIMVISKFHEPSYFVELIAEVVDGYILKPLYVDQLMSVLSKIIGVMRLAEENNKIKEQVAKITTGEFLDIEKKLQEINSEYYTNRVTGLPNRSALLRDIASGQNEKTLFLIDIKRFKRINELYGIKAGDMVLQRFGGYLREFSEDYYCSIYHISADEFALLFDDPGTLDECHQRAQVLVFYTYNRKCVISLDQRRIEITTMSNTGVAFKEPDPLQMANIALNHAMKENLPYSIYSQSFKEDLEHDETYTRILKEAIAKDNVVPYFQPIITATGEKKYEALMRIITPDRVITPYFFLDIAKKTGDYNTLTKIMIEKSFKKFQFSDAVFSINLSYQDATNPSLIEFLTDNIKGYGVADRLILEIVESESIDNFSTILNFLSPFREMGVGIAVDDFGSGYSNFSYLLQLNPEYIKIDGSIIRNIDHDEKSFLIAKTITNFARSLGIKTIAEFIHSKEVYEKAQSLGIDAFQGFYLGKPSPDLE